MAPPRRPDNVATQGWLRVSKNPGQRHARRAAIVRKALDARARRQERELIAIEALSALGRTRAAKRRARRFVARYPDSSHARTLHGLLEAPQD